MRSLLWINILLSNTCQFFGIIKITHKNTVRACKHHGNLRANPPMTPPPSRWGPNTALSKIRVANSPLTRPYQPLLSGGGCYWEGTLRLPWKQGVLVEASFVEDRPWKLLQGHHTLQAGAIHVLQKPRTCMFFQIPGSVSQQLSSKTFDGFSSNIVLMLQKSSTHQLVS